MTLQAYLQSLPDLPTVRIGSKVIVSPALQRQRLSLGRNLKRYEDLWGPLDLPAESWGFLGSHLALAGAPEWKALSTEPLNLNPEG